MRRYNYLLPLLLLGTILYSQRVINVQDGDTFQLDDGSKVRMIGINAPEKKDVYGLESKSHLESLILNKTVVLKKDELSSDYDRYNRKLRYVYVDNSDINLRMINDGFAFAYLTYNFSKSEEYKKAQINSKAIRNGMWGDGQINEIITEQEDRSNPINKIDIVFGVALLLVLVI